MSKDSEHGAQGAHGEDGAQAGYGGQSGYDGRARYGGRSAYGGQPGEPGQSGQDGRFGYGGQPGQDGRSEYGGRLGQAEQPGYGGRTGRSGYSGQAGFGQEAGYDGQSGFGGHLGQAGRSGFGGQSGASDFGGQAEQPGFGGRDEYGERSGYGREAQQVEQAGQVERVGRAERAGKSERGGISRSGKPEKKGIGRRGALGLFGLGGLLTAGGVAAGAATKELWLPTDSDSPGGTLRLNGGGAVEGLSAPTYAPSGRRPRYRRATWSELFQDGHEWTAGGEGTASSEPGDTETFTRGRQSFRVTTRGDGVQAFVRRTGMDAMDVRGKQIRLVFRVQDTAHLDRLTFHLGKREMRDTFGWEFHIHGKEGANYVQSGEWVTVHLQWADVTEASGEFKLSGRGEPSARSGFTDMSFGVFDDKAGPVTCNLQSVELIPDTAKEFPKGVVSITFDDSHASVHELARPVMDRFAMPGTLYNIAGAIGTEPFMSIGQMRSLQDSSGWEMAGHAYSLDIHQSSYAKVTAQQADEDFRRLREWLVGNGFTSEHFAYPHGAFQKTSDGIPVDMLAARHFTTARSIISETAESIAPAMPYRLKALTGVTDGQDIGGALVKQVAGKGGPLDRCALNGSWLILCLHRIVAGTPEVSTELSAEGLLRLMEEIEKRGITVLTVNEAMTYYA